MSRSQLGAAAMALSDDEDGMDGPWNGAGNIDMEAFLGQDKNNGEKDEEGRTKEKIVDANFFNKFDDDFDEDDMNLEA